MVRSNILYLTFPKDIPIPSRSPHHPHPINPKTDPPPSPPPQTINSRFLILSDTHGTPISFKVLQHEHLDIVLPCGDLTHGSKLSEYRDTIQLLQSIPIPLKLLVAGNHDFTLDGPTYTNKITEAEACGIDFPLIQKQYGHHGEARALIDTAKDPGIVFLDERSHRFDLPNGAA
ncbi:hypothetical protein BO70DRAFT_139168 [Aspergillus heteromorphus CBS 117.55]|uniref:Calcineurin-like phosphoesterase domain-containing protein n=1 Tax=Aspergillus heteromorphus CBS 117.55 TaxID=1448321 RepID=A0A317V8K8_9EURO|nr:uncharacterized protein BO70DRAFT_139168 [Aspergillus heteromorphus CBS 117.55]PWY70486.1 hypothetical protein BO70DRAFT_139168 [Aspergillus heteromorphus CBS 117.55]